MGNKSKRQGVTRISGFRKGQRMFLSTGVSRGKVTRDGEPEVLELRIKSTGIAELSDKLRSEEPQPPGKQQMVTPDSPAGRQMKLTKNEWVLMPDLTDPKYLEDKAKHGEKTTMQVILAALDEPFYDEGGNDVTDQEEKLAILRESGMSTSQFNQLYEDIQALTTLSERDRERFFGSSSDGGEAPTS